MIQLCPEGPCSASNWFRSHAISSGETWVFEKTLTVVGTVRPYAAAVRDCSLREGSGGQRWHLPLPPGSVGGLVRLNDRLRDAPAGADLVPVLPGPLADRVRLLAVGASGRLGHRCLPPGATSPTGTSAGLTTMFDEGSQGLMELVGVLVRQVDLIGTVVQ